MNRVTNYIIGASLIALATPSITLAQDGGDQNDQSTGDTLFDVIVVTGTKKADAENVQEVPIAVTAFGGEQLEALNVQDIADIGSMVPNAILDGVGTIKGSAAFSVRGNPQQDSIPTVDPTVGTFVDGMYLGVNSGVILDTFDLESIEVLRGPQGILFGRNVVGGAVVVNTRSPTDYFYTEIRGAVSSGLRGSGADYTISGIVSGPLAEGLSAKVAAYYNKDEGWFKNLARNGENFGGSETILVRAALLAEPTDNFSTMIKYEHGDVDSDGTVAQSIGLGALGRGEGFPSQHT